jgi:hypothetical protein
MELSLLSLLAGGLAQSRNRSASQERDKLGQNTLSPFADKKEGI